MTRSRPQPAGASGTAGDAFRCAIGAAPRGPGVDHHRAYVDLRIVTPVDLFPARPRPRSAHGHARDLECRQGVMAMATGSRPTFIGARAVLVAVWIGVTVPEPVLTT